MRRIVRFMDGGYQSAMESRLRAKIIPLAGEQATGIESRTRSSGHDVIEKARKTFPAWALDLLVRRAKAGI